jgi:GNAT superfamily N-acetyltransferase
MTIRPALPSEADSLARLAWRAKALWGYPVDMLEQWRVELSPTETCINTLPTFVAEIDGVVAGWCQIGMNFTPVALEHLWVDPDFMRRGVGRALITAACEHLKLHKVRMLAIDADPHAEPFYLHCGAVRTGEIAAPIPGNPNRIRPQLELSVFI